MDRTKDQKEHHTYLSRLAGFSIGSLVSLGISLGIKNKLPSKKAYQLLCSTILAGIGGGIGYRYLSPIIFAQLEKRQENSELLPVSPPSLPKEEETDLETKFKKLIEIYKGTVFCDKKLEQLIKDDLTKDGLPNSFVVCNSKDATEDIKKTIELRVPVYFGANKTNTYNEKLYKETFPQLINAPYKNPQRIVIGGIVSVYNKELTKKIGNMGSLHGYGLNFESTKTADYEKFTDNGKLKIIEAKEELLKLMKLFLKGTTEIMERTNYKKAHVRLPGIGLGYFASQIEDKNELAQLYGECLNTALEESTADITVDCYFFSGTADGEKAKYFKKRITSDKISVLTGNEKHSGDLFNLKTPLNLEQSYQANYPKNETGHITENENDRICIVVNAWDNSSWIGNGQIKDQSIDGFYVSGSNNKDFKNSSFLLNIPLTYQGYSNETEWIKI